MNIRNDLAGNILGNPRAEIDKMLEKAFVETAEFKALTNTRDFNYVVGRRGTGKSALFIKVSEFIKHNKLGYVYTKKPAEYENLEILSMMRKINADYSSIKSISRVAWRVCILMALLKDILKHYKVDKFQSFDYLFHYMSKYKSIIDYDCFKKTSEIIKYSLSEMQSINELPGIIAKEFEVERLNSAIKETLENLNTAVFFLFDGLDEGWLPEKDSTGILGGLAACSADFLDKQCGIHVILFIRDNIFRALSYLDTDFSRHIEGNTLRLRWDDTSLFNFINNRIKISLNLDKIESDVKLWNRFAHKELKNREGFISCLNYTLYRPRDVLVLLNNAFINAARNGRSEIIKEDIDSSSKQISKDRLEDLLKEYNKVFPGLHLFINIFKGKQAFIKYGEFIKILENELLTNEYLCEEASDFALLGSGKEVFYALYSIGFVGLENPTNKKLLFRHDGSYADIEAINYEQRTCIHPCYWKSLELQSETIEEDILLEVHDDEQQIENKGIQDIRTKLIGQLISLLPQMKEGIEEAKNFEDWVFRIIKILFSGHLSNPELNPNPDSVQRRDIVATNMAKDGFWGRVLQDYSSRQIVFEVKNYSSLKSEDFRQVLSYSNKYYGKFVIIVYRSQNEGLSDNDKTWVKEMWNQHGVIIFILPAIVLSRCVGKLRSSKRFDYTDNQLNKRLDIFTRSYLSIQSSKKTPKKVSK